ncbi:MAG: exodeoxyribonuclease VII large subunit [Acidobacteria bacterium]|nr:MAG: exodeoxyribonuclease VII large subunit [Acidobacteriota bacterium]
MQQQELRLFEERRILSVSQLVNEVKRELEVRFRDLWVKGEISNLRIPPSGHIYFTLKDGDAQIKAVCFRMQNRYLKFQPEDGMDVIARGSVSVYPPRGEFQLVVELMEPSGRGALQVAFEQLKVKLQGQGLFDPARKKPLPLLPRKIGIVTSPSGAAIQDILRILNRRNNTVDVLIFPARVQGAGAAEEVARGIQYLNTRTDIDVIIVGRGGGSLEDLWAFNEEVVARAIFASRLPIISAVGHEIDYTIADFVADLRAPTPSAAAEIVSAARDELCKRVDSWAGRATQAVRSLLREKRHRLQALAQNRAFVDAQSRLRFYLQKLDDLTGRLLRGLPSRLGPLRQRVTTGERDLSRQMQARLLALRNRVTSRTEQLNAYSPLAVLERGYAIVTTEGGAVVRDPEGLSDNERLRVRVAKGEFKARKES